VSKVSRHDLVLSDRPMQSRLSRHYCVIFMNPGGDCPWCCVRERRRSVVSDQIGRMGWVVAPLSAIPRQLTIAMSIPSTPGITTTTICIRSRSRSPSLHHRRHRNYYYHHCSITTQLAAHNKHHYHRRHQRRNHTVIITVSSLPQWSSPRS